MANRSSVAVLVGYLSMRTTPRMIHTSTTAMRRARNAVSVDTNALALIDKIDAVSWVEYCFCGRPRSEHTYWEDRIYDYNGYSCPGSVGGEYRYDAILSTRRHREARAAELTSLLPDPPSVGETPERS